MKKVFFSFDWDDAWQVFQIRNHNITNGVYKSGYKDEAQVEEVERKSEEGIKRWIDNQLEGTSVTCVLIGQKTYDSRFVRYEIKKSIERRNGLLGVYIHDLKDRYGNTSLKGKSPFTHSEIGFTSNNSGFPLTYPCVSYHNWNWGNDEWKNFGKWIEMAYSQANQ